MKKTLPIIFISLLLALTQAHAFSSSIYSYYGSHSTPWFEKIGLDFLSSMLYAWDVDCPAGWKCLDENYKGYLKSNCYWRDVQLCQGGCSHGQCLDTQNKECRRGWQCLDSDYLVYQNKDCSISSKYYCLWGCVDKECYWGSKFRLK